MKTTTTTTTMKTMKTISKPIILSILLILIINSLADTLTVKQDGTGDYTTIQGAVNAALDGDTVLVWPGTYFENVYCEEKNIAIGSLTITTGNTSYMQQTIIDGNKTGSCFEIRNCQSQITIDGFTLENGSGSYCGGVCGSGIYIKNTFAEIYNCIVKNNKVTGYGGGIYLHTSDAFLSNVTIKNNHAYDRGGGMLLLNSNVEFDPVNRCNIYLNYASVGTDIYKMGDGSPAMNVIVDTFTVELPDYYYMYSQGDMGYPVNDITYEINTGKIQSSNQNLYVNANGDNQNSGLTPNEPLKDISFALLKMASDSVQPDTIHVSNGTYSLSAGEKFPLSLKKNVSIQGENRDSTILDAENEIFMLNGIAFADNYKISNLTFKNGNGDTISPYNIGVIMLFENHNAIYENLFFTGNTGGIVSCATVRQSNNVTFRDTEFYNNIGAKAFRTGTNNLTQFFSNTVELINCRFIENHPDYSIPDMGFGGGAAVSGEDHYPDSMTCYLINCLFVNNHSKHYLSNHPGSTSFTVCGGGLAYVINCTMSDNTSDNPNGANIAVTSNSTLHIYNSILFDNYPSEIYMFTNSYGDCDLNVYNSLVQGGEEGIRILSPDNNVYYDETNIDTDPLFYGGPEFPYNLSDLSPCINAGTLDLPDFIELPEFDLAGNPRVYGETIDMGAYEWNPTVGVDEYKPIKKEKEKLLNAAPNPFSGSTEITAAFKTKSSIKIEVYNNHGQRVRALMDGPTLSGTSQIIWYGDDDNGQPLPSGVYHVIMFADDREIEGVKVVKR